jgi:hypothetical protein
MDLEHLFQQSNFFLVLQLFFITSLLLPGMINRTDLYGKVVRSLALNVVSFGPLVILAYVLYEVTLLH